MQKRFSICIICHSALRPQPPPCGHLLPKEGGIDTLKTPHILAPSSGRGCRAKRDGVGSPRMLKMRFPVSLSPPLSGIALYKNRRKAPHFLAFPIGEGGPRQRWIGCFRKQLTCAKTFFHLHHLSFMPPVPYPPLRGTFPSRGRLTIREYRHLKCDEAAT